MFSLNKLKSYLPGQHSLASADHRHTISLEPEIGFQLTIESAPSSTTSTGNKKQHEYHGPVLNVHLIAARHLPSLFGFKTVQGYQIKVKLFPGSKKYDSSIQTCTWPKYDETFKFPLEPDLKSSFKKYSKEKVSDNLFEKLSGKFVVFTVYALLELPPGTFNRFKGTYRSLREKGNSLIKVGKSEASNEKSSKDGKEKQKQENPNPQQLTHSESKRNIGSVTCFLDPKIFKINQKTEQFVTDEMWLPIKDITATSSSSIKSTSSSIANSTKGQIEIILELCDSIKDELQHNENDDKNSEHNVHHKKVKPPALKKQWSLTEVKKKIKNGNKSGKDHKELYLKVTTSKMRCSIKVKDEFENSAGQIYVKTTVFEHNLLSNSWKCDNFLPSLSTRWDPDKSTIIIPIDKEDTLKNISIKTTVATKTKVGKKIVLGTVLIGPQASGVGFEHWNSLIQTRNEPIAQWHNFM